LGTCHNCHKKNLWRKTQERVKIGDNWVRVWQCRCGEKQHGDLPQEIKVKPKVLYFDIETALMTLTNFSIYVPQKYIPTDAIIENSFVLCWAACYVDESLPFQYVMSDCVRQEEALRNDDKRILEQLWSLLDSSDYWVGHNSDKFDVRRVNARFKANNMPAPYIGKQVDTIKLARKYFAEESYRLDYLAKKKGGEGKKHMERADWHKIRMTGDAEALLKMETYCRQDVREGVGVYIDDKNWIESSGRKIIK